jgi:hypothetical protein
VIFQLAPMRTLKILGDKCLLAAENDLAVPTHRLLLDGEFWRRIPLYRDVVRAGVDTEMVGKVSLKAKEGRWKEAFRISGNAAGSRRRRGVRRRLLQPATRRLACCNVHPYYVYVHDMVSGVEDLRTTIERAVGAARSNLRFYGKTSAVHALDADGPVHAWLP